MQPQGQKGIFCLFVCSLMQAPTIKMKGQWGLSCYIFRSHVLTGTMLGLDLFILDWWCLMSSWA